MAINSERERRFKPECTSIKNLYPTLFPTWHHGRAAGVWLLQGVEGGAAPLAKNVRQALWVLYSKLGKIHSYRLGFVEHCPHEVARLVGARTNSFRPALAVEPGHSRLVGQGEMALVLQ